MTNWQIVLIKYVLRWLPADPHGGFQPDSPTNNFAFTTVFAKNDRLPENKADVRELSGDTLTCFLGAESGYVDLRVSEISNPRFRVRIYKKGWQLHTESLIEAAFILSGGLIFRHVGQAIYNRRLKVYEDRVGILQVALEMKKERLLSDDESITEIVTGDVPIKIGALLRRIYGVRIAQSPAYYSLYKLTEFQVEAWIESGEFTRTSRADVSDGFIVTAKAINTIAVHQLDMQKHRDSLRPARWVAVATFLLFLVAAIQVYLAYDSNHGKTDQVTDVKQMPWIR